MKRQRRRAVLFLLLMAGTFLGTSRAGGAREFAGEIGPCCPFPAEAPVTVEATAYPLLSLPPLTCLEQVEVLECPRFPPDPPVPVVAIRVRVPSLAPGSKELTYRICVENQSPAAAHHVLVRNPLPANARFLRAHPEPMKVGTELRWELGTMPGGCSREIMLVLSPTGNTDISNCARVQFEHGQCVTTRIVGAAPPDQPPVRPPDVKAGAGKLSLSMTGPKRQYLNLPAEYFITVANSGTAPVTNVLVSNTIPEKMNFVRAGQEGKMVANQAAWLLGTLDPGTSKTVEIVLQAKGAGEVCNKAKAMADHGLFAQAEHCTLFEGTSALLLEMVDRKDPVEVGGETSYPIVVVNQGSLPVSNVQIKAFIPAAMLLARAKGASDNRLGEKTPDGYQVLLFEPLAKLMVGGKAEYEVFVKAVRPGDVRFKVELMADQLKAGGPVHEEESTTIYSEAGEGARPPGLQTRLPRIN